jgi:predicted  nucleic acid-binding Zn-ribbon protein
MEEADALVAEQKKDEAALARAGRETDAAKAALGAERTALDHEIARLTELRGSETRHVDARTLVIYEQLLRTRRGVAVAGMVNGHCMGCHVRLRPPVEQHVRRNDAIVQCESCQRILYYAPPGAAAEAHEAEKHAAGSGR